MGCEGIAVQYSSYMISMHGGTITEMLLSFIKLPPRKHMQKTKAKGKMKMQVTRPLFLESPAHHLYSIRAAHSIPMTSGHKSIHY